MDRFVSIRHFPAYRSVAVFLVALILLFSSNAQSQQLEATTGLIISDGWQLVEQTCTRCHSAQIITQNSGSREVWQSRIIWVQQTQGLEQLSPEILDPILDYLAQNYGQKAATRRLDLKEHLLPSNPYTTID